MSQPFQVSIGFNDDMDAWDVGIQIGGYPTEEAAKETAKLLAEFIAGDTGWAKKLRDIAHH